MKSNEILTRDMIMPKVSVIIPVYNTSGLLNRCLSSVMGQDYSNLEVIIINDGSTDNSKSVLQKWDASYSNIEVISTENRGLSGARNTGVMAATGEYVIFIDSDDWVDEDYVSYLVKLVVSGETQIASSQHRVIFPNHKVVNHAFSASKPKIMSSAEWFAKVFCNDTVDLSAWGKIYSINLFKEIEFPVGKLFEDSYTTYKFLLKAKKITVGAKSTYSYVIRKGSISQSSFSKQKLDLISATDQMVCDVISVYPELKHQAQQRRIWSRLSVLRMIVEANNSKQYVKLVKRLRADLIEMRKDIFTSPYSSFQKKLATSMIILGTVPFKLLVIANDKLHGKL